tara:strand:+ start:286 stop:483 length:198 start_codon:yes stop_codon:yes gene_type:complete
MKEKTPYDYFLMNLKMTEMMVKKMKGQGSNNDTVRTQILMLQDMIENLERLQTDLTSVLEEETPN